MNFKIKIIFIFLVFLFVNKNLSAQSVILESYVKDGFESNKIINQQGLLVKKADLAIEEANDLKKPQVNFNFTYTLAAGGRAIDFPIGDILNPVYNNLNKQLVAQGKTPQFTDLQNQKVTFLPNNFYDTRFRTTYPLLNPDIRLNKTAKELQRDLMLPDVEIAKKDLEKDIKSTYFRYLQANQALKIFDYALGLLQEVKRMNESMVRNDIAIPSILYRVKNDMAKVTAQKIELQNNLKNAQLLFNTLINKPLETKIEIDTFFYAFNSTIAKSTEVIEVNNRAEVSKIMQAAKLLHLKSSFEQSYYKPRIGTFLDLGSQGYVYKDQFKLYFLGGITVDYPIWDAHRNHKRIEQAGLDEKAFSEQSAYLKDQLTLQAKVKQNDYNSAIEVFETTKSQVDLTKRYYRDTQKRYIEGQAIYLELSDAHTQLLNAELQQSIALMNIWIRKTELERVK